ncbi:phage tail protein [Luteimonas gilva]|uniref:Phage tail protein n=1 Tax=Luteimonas gilva TaxID=2572684 RepID=A0A4U5K3C4_9GAMM|nr:tail fiber protein [Luteimonas gilva]TKR33489.1 phage tail protein [Luteimonas gilva]
MSEPYVGEIRLFGFSRLPNGWLPCDGSLQPISNYDVLFNLIGTTYGGDGQVTFAMPDLRGQVPLHWGNGPGLTPRTPGEAGGSENVTLIQGQMPAHSHTMYVTSATSTATAVGNGVNLLGTVAADTMYATDITGLGPIALSPQSVSLSGGNQPHENTMPTLTVQFCIAYAGIYPSQS